MMDDYSELGGYNPAADLALGCGLPTEFAKIEEGQTVIDLGSGAGFPAIILSIAGVEDVTMIESDSRKSAFLLQASRLSNCKPKIINDRIENIDNLSCDILTSRAFAELDSIFEYSTKIEVKDKYLLHKGAGYKNEILNARKHWLFNTTVHDSITSETGKILEIIGLERI